jgi:hypothetical protein
VEVFPAFNVDHQLPSVIRRWPPGRRPGMLPQANRWSGARGRSTHPRCAPRVPPKRAGRGALTQLRDYAAMQGQQGHADARDGDCLGTHGFHHPRLAPWRQVNPTRARSLPLLPAASDRTPVNWRNGTRPAHPRREQRRPL